MLVISRKSLRGPNGLASIVKAPILPHYLLCSGTRSFCSTLEFLGPVYFRHFIKDYQLPLLIRYQGVISRGYLIYILLAILPSTFQGNFEAA